MTAIHKYKQAMRWFTRPKIDPSIKQLAASLPYGTQETYGAPEQIDMPNIQDIIREEGIQVGPQVKDGGRVQYKPGGLVEPGVTHYARKSPTKINEETFKKIDDFIAKSEGTLSKKALGESLGYKTVEKGRTSGQGGLNKVIAAWEKDRRRTFEFKPATMVGTELEQKILNLSKDPKYIKEDGTPNIKRLAKDIYPDRKLDDARKQIRHTLERAVGYEGKTNIAGPTTGAKELKKRREKIIKELRQYWKGQKGGELILKQMDKKLADIAAENKSILKMSDDAIWNNKKFQDAMRLNVKALNTGEGLKFDRYQGISKKDFAKSVRDLAAKGQFVQPEHIIPIKARNPDSLLAKNIFSAYGKVGGQMEVLKDFSKANTFGKKPKEVFNFLKGQNIPIEKPGFWKTTKKVGSKAGRFLFHPVEMGALPLAVAAEGLYANYANKRDLKKALDQIPNSKLPQYKKNLILEGYRQEARDVGDVGLETYAVDQPNVSGALEKIGLGDKKQMMDLSGGLISGIREVEAAKKAAKEQRIKEAREKEIGRRNITKGYYDNYLPDIDDDK